MPNALMNGKKVDKLGSGFESLGSSISNSYSFGMTHGVFVLNGHEILASVWGG